MHNGNIVCTFIYIEMLTSINSMSIVMEGAVSITHDYKYISRYKSSFNLTTEISCKLYAIIVKIYKI